MSDSRASVGGTDSTDSTGSAGGPDGAANARGNEIVVRTPAKINLALLVGPPRPDGFHELASVYQAVDLYDEVTATPAPDGEFSVEASGPGADDVPTGADSERNLAVRAARLLAEEHGLSGGVRLAVRKGIPVAGGMAGGSSDAAAALVACDALWGTGLSESRLLELAARLGSDVPFCLLGGTALGSGHGEVVAPLPDAGRYHWALAFAGDGLSTPAVYAGLDRRRAGEVIGHPMVGEELLAALAAGDSDAVGRALTNDLQSVALAYRPELSRVLAAGERLGAIRGLVSGSGPTCAFLCRDPEHATTVAAGLSATGECSGTATATGPAPGARHISHQG